MARSSRKVILSSLVAVAAAGLALAPAVADTTPVTARASVVSSAGGSVDKELNFGAFTAGGVAGTVTIDPRYTGLARLSYTGVTMVDTSEISDVWFYVTGTPNALYRIYLPSSCTITRAGGASMLVDNFRCCPTSMMSGGSRVLSTIGRLRRRPSGGYPAGTDEFNVGATLHVAAHQAPGTYTGVFEVGVGYE